MKANEEGLLQAFYHFWDTYARREKGVDTIQSIVPLFADQVTAIGSGEHEIAGNLDEVIVNFTDDFKEFSSPFKLEFFATIPKLLSPTSGFVEAQCNFELDVNGETLNFYLRVSTVFIWEKDRWLLIHNHISFPSQEQDIGKAFPIDALVAKNNHLEKLVAERTLALKQKTHLLIQEQEKTDRLLFNVLPKKIVAELKEKGKADAQYFNDASILFTDFKSFTQASEDLSPQDLVSEISICFEAFDSICDRYGIEKIKTIGDAYMAAGGIPVPFEQSTSNTVLAALEMQDFMERRNRSVERTSKPVFEMRAGIHTGQVVAGIVGTKKFHYDVWGDTVNVANRMEATCDVGRVNISESTFALLNKLSLFNFENRGKVKVKGKQDKIAMYYVSRSSVTNQAV